MSDIEAGYRETGPFRFRRDTGISLAILLAVLFAVAAISVAVLAREGSETLILIIMAGLAIVGVFSLFGVAIGLLHVGSATKEDDLTHAFADLMEDAVLITDPNGQVLYANSAYVDMFKVAKRGDIPTVEQAFTGNAVVSESIFRLSRALQRGESRREEIRMPSTAGPEAGTEQPSRWFRISVQPLAPKAGTPGERPNFVWRICDTTGERLQEENSVQRLQKAIEYLDHAPAGFLSLSSGGEVDHVNATLATWLGIDLSDRTARRFAMSELVSESDAGLLFTAMDEAARSGKTVTQDFDIDLTRADGRKFAARLLCRFTPYSAKHVQAHCVVLNRASGMLFNNAAGAGDMRFARFFHSAPIAIATVDPAGRIGNMNGTFARMFARMPSGAIKAGGSIFAIADDHDQEALKKALATASAGEHDLPPFEITFGSDGQRNGRLFVSPIDHADDDEDVAILYAIDTTEQRALEIQIAQSQKMQAVGQLAGGIAHDFNNVLTAIIGFSDLLLTSHRPTDPAFKDIMNIKQNANRAAGLVRQLLAFSRQQTLRPKILSLTDVISDLQVLLSRLLGEKIALNVNHGRDLWFVKVDVNQFEQVIINLAVNARDAMPEGGNLTIHTENVVIRENTSRSEVPLEPGEYVLCEVTDTGCGISPEIIEKIFDPFFSTKEVGKGTGLGLSTVYGIVKQTGGYVFTDSEIGEGTSFKIYLPRHFEEIDTDASEARAEKKDKQRDLTGTGCVLLVEDEEAVRTFAARALTSRGYKVLEAASGVEALDVMKGHTGSIDLVVSDVVMPEMDGPTLLKELRKTHPDLKIIFISGYAEEAFRNNLDEAEKFMFLPKPFSLKQLAGSVKEVLGS